MLRLKYKFTSEKNAAHTDNRAGADAKMHGGIVRYIKECFGKITPNPLSVTNLLPFKKVAFTLAEVLITLGIIAVVAALTLPSVIEKHQKQVTVTKLKKAYSTLSQAFVRSVADNGDAANWVDTNTLLTEENVREYFDLYWAPYLKVLKFCYSQKDCGYKTNINYYNGNFSTLSFFGGQRVSILTTDGMYMFFRSVNYRGKELTFSKQQQIFVDINAGKAPNVYGKDVFLFILGLDNAKINPYGIDFSKDEINSKCYGADANYLTTCAAKIISEGWQINY